MARRIALIGLSLLLAVLGTLAVFVYVSQADSRARAGQQPHTVLMAAKVIPMGTTVEAAFSEKMVVARTVTKNVVPAGALADATAVRGRVATGDIQPGEMLLASKFQKPEALSALPLEKGLMAVSVMLEDPQRVAGFVAPGSQVAVFDTYAVDDVKVTATQTSETTVEAEGVKVEERTQVLLPRATVIAVGPTTTRAPAAQASGGDEKPQNTQANPQALLTIAVTQADAEKLVHGTQTGRLYMALLTKDSVTGPSTGVDNKTIFGK